MRLLRGLRFFRPRGEARELGLVTRKPSFAARAAKGTRDFPVKFGCFRLKLAPSSEFFWCFKLRCDLARDRTDPETRGLGRAHVSFPNTARRARGQLSSRVIFA